MQAEAKERRAEWRSQAARMACLLLVLSVVLVSLVGLVAARFTTEGTASDGARVAAFAFTMQDGEASESFSLDAIKKPGDPATYEFTVSNKKGSTVSEVAQRYLFTVSLAGSVPLKCEIKEKNGENAGGTGGTEGSGGAGGTGGSGGGAGGSGLPLVVELLDPSGSSPAGTPATPSTGGASDPSSDPSTDPAANPAANSSPAPSTGGATEDPTLGVAEGTAVAGQFAASEERTDTYTLTVTWPEDENDVKYASRSAVADVTLTVRAEQID